MSQRPGRDRQPADRRWPAGCTIVARNYLSHARVLAESFTRHHPGANFYLLVVDPLPQRASIGDHARLVEADELPLTYFAEMCFKYNVTELSTAVKPTYLSLLFDQYGEDEVIYFDPDILITRPLEELRKPLAANGIVLTPHLLQPLPNDGLEMSERAVLVAGAFNLGFVAVKNADEPRRFLRWWEEHLRDDCQVNPCRGLMVDQKWVDLAPSLFPTTHALRNDTYNVAYWNIHSRAIERNERDRYLVNGRPLSFFHFSGFDPTYPRVLSKHQNRAQIVDGSALADLVDEYVELQLRHGYETSSKWRYGYGTFDNGLPINSMLRQLYLNLERGAREQFGDPFEADRPNSFFEWAVRPRTAERRHSRFLERVYQMRADVAAAFPDAWGRHREAFVAWARTDGAQQMGYDPRLVRVGNPPQALVPVASGAANGGQLVATESQRAHRGAGDEREPRQRREVSAASPVPAAVSDAAVTPFPTATTAITVNAPTAPRAAAAPNGPTLGGGSSRASVRKPDGVNVSGYLRNESGIGANARGYIRALRTLGVPLALNDVSGLSVNRSEDRSLDRFDTDNPYDVNLICVNADQHFVVMSHLGDAYLKDHYNVGVWYWELPSFPPEWHDRFPFYDELWVGSSFIANALAPVSPVPIVRVPPVLATNAPGDRERGRERLGVAPADWVFLFMFDFHSYVQRKNPLAVIDAFKQAFRPNDPVRLVIKCVNEQASPREYAELQARAAGHPISVYAGYWSGAEVRDVMAACDAYVSLHRSEGAGLTISDAMAHGKPTIATGWSGNMDFMNVGNSFPVRYELVELTRNIGPYPKGATWAEPSVEHAADLMRLVFEDRDEAFARGQTAKQQLAEQFSEDAVADLMRRRLEVIARRPRAAGGRMEAVVPEVAPASNQNGYAPSFADELREVARVTLPADAAVAVAADGDAELLNLGDRPTWPFPRADDGGFADYSLPDSQAAIAHLEAVRADGIEYFVLPRTAYGWVDALPAFRHYLEQRHRRIWGGERERCTVYQLAPLNGAADNVSLGRIDARMRRLEASVREPRAASNGVDVEARVNDLALRLATELQARLHEFEERVTSADETRLSDLAEGLVEAVEAQMRELEARVTSATEARLAELETALTGTGSASLSDLETRLTTDADTRLNDVEKRLTTDAEARVQELEERLASTDEARLDELATSLARVVETYSSDLTAKLTGAIDTRADVLAQRIAAGEEQASLAVGRVNQVEKRVTSDAAALGDLRGWVKLHDDQTVGVTEHIVSLEERVAGLQGWVDDDEDRTVGQLAGIEARVADLDQALADRTLELANVTDEFRGQADRLDAVALDATQAKLRFAARPYMATDLFGAFGDLDKPMGYAIDAATLGTLPTTAPRFPDVFRGAEEFIAERQRPYLDFLRGMKRVVDLGSGRGEFLRLLAEHDIPAVGVELDAALVASGRAQGLDVVEGDGIEYVREQAAGSLDAIFSAQVIEHLTPEQLTDLLALAKDRLREGGLFIAETVNPESFEALKVFSVDATHVKPIYPQVVLYHCLEAGYRSARIFYPVNGGFTQRAYQSAGEYAVIAVR